MVLVLDLLYRIMKQTHLLNLEIMKLSKLILLMLLAIATVSCSNDDDGAEPFLLTKRNLAGNYKTQLLTVHIEQTFTVNNAPILSVTDIAGDTFQVNTTFYEDGTFTRVGNFRILTTITTGPIVNTESEIITVDETGTYVIGPTGNTITLRQNGDSQTFDVKLFNETKLNLERNSTDPINDVPTMATFKINLSRN